jgi:hypothetical protein
VADRKLVLYFAGDWNAQLIRVQFSHPLAEKDCVSVRGFYSPGNGISGSFQWSRAVKALSILLLRTKISSLDSISSASKIIPAIEGDRNSFAASLDYALSKQPFWLLDMFGVSAQGKSIAQRLFRRQNSERKRSGPVVISMNENMLKPEALKIYLDGVLVNSASGLLKIEKSIESGSFPAGSPSNGSSLRDSLKQGTRGNNTALSLQDHLMNLIRAEVLRMFRDAYIFSSRRLGESVDRLGNDQAIRSISGERVCLTSEIDLRLPSSARFGLLPDENQLRKAFTGDRPLRFALTAFDTNSLAIFVYLKHIKGYNIEYEYLYNYSAELVDLVLNGSGKKMFHGLASSPYPAVRLIAARRRSEYLPLMFVPKASHRVVAPMHAARGYAALNRGTYVVPGDEPTSCTRYFDELIEGRHISPANVFRQSVSGDEIVDVLRNGNEDTKAIVAFPNYDLYKLIGLGKFVDRDGSSLAYNESILLVHKSFFGKNRMAELIDIAVRDAWLELAEGGDAYQKVMQIIAADEVFLKYLLRSCGMYKCGNFPLAKPEASIAKNGYKLHQGLHLVGGDSPLRERKRAENER